MARQVFSIAIVLLIAAWAPTSAQAQTSGRDSSTLRSDSEHAVASEQEGDSFADRARRHLARLHALGLYPDVGSIVPGSGISAGVAFRKGAPDSFFGVDANAAWSVRGYAVYGIQAGRLGGHDAFFRLEPADTNLASLFKGRVDAAPQRIALYADVRYRDYPQVEFFGTRGAPIATRTDFGLSGTSADAVLLWNAASRLGIAARAGVLDLDVARGTNRARADLFDVFGEPFAPGLNRPVRFATAGLAAAVDTRDHYRVPTVGMFVAGAVTRYEALTDTGSFTRVAVDARGYRSLGTPRVVLAGRVLGSHDWDEAADLPTPFFLESWLGGAHALRSESSYRFRGTSLATASAELRWRVMRWVEIAPFADIGGAAPGFSDVRLHHAVGLGLRGRTDSRVLFRMDWAYGTGGHRLLFAMSPVF